MISEQRLKALEERLTALEEKFGERANIEEYFSKIEESTAKIEELQKRMYSMTDATLKASLEFPVRILNQIKELRDLVDNQDDNKSS